MQNPNHWRKECDSCGAHRGQPCRTIDGYVAQRVHWGRTSPPRCKIEGQGKEADFWLLEFEVIAGLVPYDPKFVGTKERPILFEGTNICADCGELYSGPGLLRRCAERHPARIRA